MQQSPHLMFLLQYLQSCLHCGMLRPLAAPFTRQDVAADEHFGAEGTFMGGFMYRKVVFVDWLPSSLRALTIYMAYKVVKYILQVFVFGI